MQYTVPLGARADFGRLVNPISTRSGRLCPPYYYWHPQILSDQLTLSQPEGANYAHHFTTGTSGFSDIPTALVREQRHRSYTLVQNATLHMYIVWTLLIFNSRFLMLQYILGHINLHFCERIFKCQNWFASKHEVYAWLSHFYDFKREWINIIKYVRNTRFGKFWGLKCMPLPPPYLKVF